MASHFPDTTARLDGRINGQEIAKAPSIGHLHFDGSIGLVAADLWLRFEPRLH
jgi:hypothetical protein